MQTLQKYKEIYLTLKHERIELLNFYKNRNEKVPITPSCELLMKVYEAKQNYAKCYHGSAFEELNQRLTILRVKLNHIYKEYEKNPDETKMMECQAEYDRTRFQLHEDGCEI